jgi:hypothetical protein
MPVAEPQKSPVPAAAPQESTPHIEAGEVSYAWPEAGDGEERTPNSLEAALIRQISERTPAPGLVAAAPGAASIVDTSELKARVPGTPPRGESTERIPSLPPDAVVPGSTSDEKIKLELASTAAVVPANISDNQIQTSKLASTVEAPAPLRSAPKIEAAREPQGEVPFTPRPRSPADARAARQPRRGGFFVALVLAFAMIAALLYFLQSQEGRPAESNALPAEPTSVLSPPAPSTPPASPVMAASSAVEGAELVEKAAATPSASASAEPTAGEDLPLPVGAVVTPGQGLLDIETGAREAIFVDSVELGRGPFLRLTLTPGVHEVRLRAHGEERIRFVLIRPARRTRLPLSSAWAR